MQQEAEMQSSIEQTTANSGGVQQSDLVSLNFPTHPKVPLARIII